MCTQALGEGDLCTGVCSGCRGAKQYDQECPGSWRGEAMPMTEASNFTDTPTTSLYCVERRGNLLGWDHGRALKPASGRD